MQLVSQFVFPRQATSKAAEPMEPTRREFRFSKQSKYLEHFRADRVGVQSAFSGRYDFSFMPLGS